MNLLNVRTAEDFRAFLYVLLPVVGTMFVSYGVFTEGQWQLWAGLAAAVLGPVVAAIKARTLSAFRTAFYVVFGAIQAIVIGYGLATPEQFETWIPLVVAIVGLSAGGAAAANTDTSPSDMSQAA